MNNPVTITYTAADWLVRLRDPSVTPVEISRWMAWCNAASEHRVAFERMQSTWQAAGAIQELPIDPLELAAAIPPAPAPAHPLQLLCTQWRRRGARQREGKAKQGTQAPEGRDTGRVRVGVKVRRGTWAVAAAVACIAIFIKGSDDFSITAPTGVNRKISLPDRTAVTLAAGSTLSTYYDREARNVVLDRGEAYFQVRKDPTRPFVVQTQGARITAIGTAFNVRSEAGILKVSVTEGAVDVHMRGRNSRVAVGQGYALDSADRAPTVRPALATRANAWIHGTLQFTNEPLRSVVAAVNRYSQERVTLEDSSLQELRFTGTVDANRINEWLQGLPNVFPVSVQTGEGGDAIRISRGK